jgi:hypothetical protein
MEIADSPPPATKLCENCGLQFMRWNKLFIPTLRAAPPAEGPGRALLIRAGYIRPCAGAADGYLPLAQRSLGRIARQIHAEMERLGALEVGVPAAAQLAAGRARRPAQLQAAPAGMVFAPRTAPCPPAGLPWTPRASKPGTKNSARRCGAWPNRAVCLRYRRTPQSAPSTPRISCCRSIPRTDRLAACSACGWLADWERSAAVARPPAVADPAGDLAPEPFPHSRAKDHRRRGAIYRPARHLADEEPGADSRRQAGTRPG